MILTTLDILYIVLITFTAILWTLLTIVLLRLVKILWVIQEITWYYDKIKQVLSAYSKIPEIVKDTIKDKFWKEK